MAEVKEKKKNRLVEAFKRDYKFEGLLLLLLSMLAIIVGGWFLAACYKGEEPFRGVFLLDDYDKVFSWLLLILGVVSLLFSIWPYYKPSIYEVKRITWPSKKEMLESSLATFIFSLVLVLFFFLCDQLFVQLLPAIEK